MKRIDLTAHARTGSGKGPNRRLRAQGQIPAVLYGLKADPMMLAVNAHEFSVSTSRTGGEMVMFNLSVPEADLAGQLTLIKEAQRDPVTERITHLDLLRIDASKPIDVEVPVRGTGIPMGVTVQGGVLEHGMRSVHLRCLVADIPDHITVDISNIAIGHAYRVSDLQLGDRIEILSHPSDVLFLVAVPRKEEVAATTAEAAGAAEEAKPGEEKKEEKKEEPAKK